MKNIISTALFLFAFLIITTHCYAIFSNAKITIKVVGEDGAPIEDAEVGVGFDDYRSKNKENSVTGTTNLEGVFAAADTTTSGYLGYTVTKIGYYESYGNYQYNKHNLLRWEPWNPEIMVLLRKIEKPVPMYARRIRKEIPFTKKEIGFDLIKCDWVVPYGQGQTADFNAYLEVDDAGEDNFEFRLRIIFPGKFNGFYTNDENILVGSAFKMPRYAQINGYDYIINVFWRGLNRGGKLSWHKNRHYIIRVRSEETNGKLIKGLYGKIPSDIALRSNRKTGGLLSYLYFSGHTNYPNGDRRCVHEYASQVRFGLQT